ncbi:MAG: integrating conjugative element protein [Acidobacteria bacterium]|nr:integrating conjugative element protein [Acidobacteriota bacterium]
MAALALVGTMKEANAMKRKASAAAALAALVATAGLPALADDELLYRLRGAEPISLGPSARASTLRLGVSAEWESDLVCGNFDVASSVRNQLNGVSGAFQEVMGNVVQTAQGVVASLPALAIQRLNPGLYDLLQNGVLEAGQEFRVAKLRCDEIADGMGGTLVHEGWSGIARADYWRRQVNVGGRDVVEVVREADASGADGGVPWIGGIPAGGAGQQPIEAVGDVSRAGYNLLLGRAPGDASAVGPAACGESDICRAWDDPDQLAAWMGRVVGEIEVRTCDGCRRVTSRAGLGLASLYRREKSELSNVLRPLAQTDAVPGEAVLDGLGGGAGFRVTRRVIEAIREEPRPVDVADRLAGELAVGRVMEQAAMARRALLAGMREPHVANNEAALRQSERALVELDREIRQMEVELRVKALVASNSSVAVLQRAGIRKRIPVWEASPAGGLREGAPE